jgi:hypothetical protein
MLLPGQIDELDRRERAGRHPRVLLGEARATAYANIWREGFIRGNHRPNVSRLPPMLVPTRRQIANTSGQRHLCPRSG